jgi:hypothetical protein
MRGCALVGHLLEKAAIRSCNVAVLILAIRALVWDCARRDVRGKGGIGRAQVNDSRSRSRDIGVVATRWACRFDPGERGAVVGAGVGRGSRRPLGQRPHYREYFRHKCFQQWLG